ncbi:MAG: glycosyltransferase, partial [Patescibacteria group bacterium]
DEVHGIPFFTPFYARKPILVLIHEVAGEIWGYTFGFPLNKLGPIIDKFYLKIYENKKFWTDSKFTIDELVKFGIERKNCLSIPCPSNAKVLQKLPTKNKKYTFISINRIVKMKGIEDVIDAFSIINKKIKESELWIIGTGDPEYIKSLKINKIEKLNLKKHIKFWGFVSEKKKLELMRKSHLLLHGSIKEGWGLVVIEAASQGTPSVVYNSSGLNESVKNNTTGLVVSQNTPLQMATEVISLISDKKRYNSYQINGLKWAKELNWENAANLSLRLLKNEK